MSEETKKEVNEHEEEHPSHTKESLEAFGQIILGEIEKVGGILTANQTAQEEGDYNIAVGKLHKEVADELEESEDEES